MQDGALLSDRCRDGRESQQVPLKGKPIGFTLPPPKIRELNWNASWLGRWETEWNPNWKICPSLDRSQERDCMVLITPCGLEASVNGQPPSVYVMNLRCLKECWLPADWLSPLFPRQPTPESREKKSKLSSPRALNACYGTSWWYAFLHLIWR